MLSRILKIQLPKGQSAFLWGARQTGKSSYLRAHYPNAIYYDLLDTHEASVAQIKRSSFYLGFLVGVCNTLEDQA